MVTNDSGYAMIVSEITKLENEKETAFCKEGQ